MDNNGNRSASREGRVSALLSICVVFIEFPFDSSYLQSFKKDNTESSTSITENYTSHYSMIDSKDPVLLSTTACRNIDQSDMSKVGTSYKRPNSKSRFTGI